MGKKMYLNSQVAKIIGLTPRQVISWTEKGLIEPIKEAIGQGTKREYNYLNLIEFTLCKKYFDMGLGIRMVKRIMSHLRHEKLLLKCLEEGTIYKKQKLQPVLVYATKSGFEDIFIWFVCEKPFPADYTPIQNNDGGFFVNLFLLTQWVDGRLDS